MGLSREERGGKVQSSLSAIVGSGNGGEVTMAAGSIAERSEVDNFRLAA